jgi:hypothetical protein
MRVYAVTFHCVSILYLLSHGVSWELSNLFVSYTPIFTEILEEKVQPVHM